MLPDIIDWHLIGIVTVIVLVWLLCVIVLFNFNKGDSHDT